MNWLNKYIANNIIYAVVANIFYYTKRYGG